MAEQIIRYTSENGYSGVLYGKRSFSIRDATGVEVYHTGNRRIDTFEDPKAKADGFPGFLEKMKKLTYTTI